MAATYVGWATRVGVDLSSSKPEAKEACAWEKGAP